MKQSLEAAGLPKLLQEGFKDKKSLNHCRLQCIVKVNVHGLANINRLGENGIQGRV